MSEYRTLSDGENINQHSSSDKLKKRLEQLGKIRESDKNVSGALIKALETLARIEEAIINGQLKPLFTMPDVWKLLGGKDANSKEAKRSQRDLANLVLMEKVYIIKDACPTCGSILGIPYYSLQPFKEQYDFKT